jgi:hypothetical protein
VPTRKERELMLEATIRRLEEKVDLILSMLGRQEEEEDERS